MAYFPMFFDINKKHCLVVGGGKVALRKVQVLLDFGAHVMVIAPGICDEIKNMGSSPQEGVRTGHGGMPKEFAERGELSGDEADCGSVDICEREYIENDLQEHVLVVAATDDAALNHEIAEAAKKKHIPVNAVDQPEDCTFIFPSYIRKKNVVGAFSSAGNSPVLTQYLKEETKKVLTDELGEINEYMGSIRETVKKSLPTERERKMLYQQVLRELLRRNEAGEPLYLSELELQKMNGTRDRKKEQIKWIEQED